MRLAALATKLATLALVLTSIACSLQQASCLESMQRKLGRSRTYLGSLPEAIEVFDLERLQAIIIDLAKQVKPIQNISD